MTPLEEYLCRYSINLIRKLEEKNEPLGFVARIQFAQILMATGTADKEALKGFFEEGGWEEVEPDARREA